jgi:hypothetical protein
VVAFLAELAAYLECELDRAWIDDHEQVPAATTRAAG